MCSQKVFYRGTNDISWPSQADLGALVRHKSEDLCLGYLWQSLLILFVSTRSNTFVRWLIRLIVPCWSQFVVPGFFGKVCEQTFSCPLGWFLCHWYCSATVRLLWPPIHQEQQYAQMRCFPAQVPFQTSFFWKRYKLVRTINKDVVQ